jgi:hypothetical protein
VAKHRELIEQLVTNTSSRDGLRLAADTPTPPSIHAVLDARRYKKTRVDP